MGRRDDHLRGRVRQIERGRDEGYGGCVSILVTEARYKVDAESGLVYSISCEGRVISGMYSETKSYDGAHVSIEFQMFERDSHNELPDRAFFGEFSYSPKAPDKLHSSPHFSFYLKHMPEDVRGLLLPLLTQEAGTQVILTVNLGAEEEELLAATDNLDGSVRHYSFEARRRLVNDRAALKQLGKARERLEQRMLEAGFLDDQEQPPPKPGDPDFLDWANREGKYTSWESRLGKGVSEEHFHRIRRTLLAGDSVSDIELHGLSFDQLGALVDELSPRSTKPSAGLGLALAKLFL